MGHHAIRAAACGAAVAFIATGAWATTPAAESISLAFQEKGMDAGRSACYGATIADRLSPERREKARTIVAEATDKSEIRAGVTRAGLGMIGAFMAAKRTCDG